MIIAIVSDAIYPYHKGGKEKRIHELSTRLARMGQDVHIYTMKWWDGPNNKIEDGVNLHAISKLYPLYVGERRSIKGSFFFGVACLKLIYKKFDITDVDHMPYFPIFSMWLVCLLKRKTMFGTWHEVWGKKYWNTYLGYAGILASLMERVSVHLPNQIISISNHTSQRLRDVLSYKGDIEVLSPGLDFKNIKNIKSSGAETDLIYAGRLLKHKNVDMLIRAVAELKNNGQEVKCLIIGEGPEKKRLLKLSEKLKLSSAIKFHDFYYSHDELYSHIKASKVFVLPSSREGFGIVVIEANACGKPVVTNLTDFNGAKDLVTEGNNGFLFDNNTMSLAETLSCALLNYENLQSKCINFARLFDWDKLAKHSLEIYSK